jgi:multidrug efflux system outer membrane protein
VTGVNTRITNRAPTRFDKLNERLYKKTMKNFLTLLLILTLTSCTMEPKYTRPKPELPFNETDKNKKKISTISFEEYFQSEDLKRVIQLALDNNRDLRIATLNITSAQQAHNIARAALLPTINATGFETRQKAPGAFASISPKRQFRANLNTTAYELDFFGRIRSLKKAALETYLATQQARKVIKIALISETANSYAQLLLDSEILKITEGNLAAQSNRLRLVELRYQNGIASQIDLLNATALIEMSRATNEVYKKLVEQDKNALKLLVGDFSDKALPQNTSLNDIKINEDLLDLVASETLLDRPDIRQAEHVLKSANANIGAARAAFFPSITLTGTYGYGSKDLVNLSDGRTWTFTPQINLPIFTAGRNIAGLKIANTSKQIEIAAYEKAIQTAFREASDELAERKSITTQLKSFNKIFESQKKFYDLSEARHKEGIASALDILDIEIASLTAQQNQLSSKKEYIANLINLYKVMGGGSEVAEQPSVR